MNLRSFFSEFKAYGLAFSGGADSSYLLYAGLNYAADIKAYYVKTAFQPSFELSDALALTAQLGVPLNVLERDITNERRILENTEKRCYFCKRVIFETLMKYAAEDGCDVIIDGTNASDDEQDRPGMRILKEMSIRSPLRECGLTKDKIRELSREAGLFTWDKPSYSCLATRIPVGTPITTESLRIIESTEDILFDLGFSDFRVRFFGDEARIQLKAAQMPALLEKRDSVLNGLKPYFSKITLDLDER